MKLMVSGYGEIKHQFGTMRCDAVVTDKTVVVDSSAATYANGAVEAGIRIKGTTNKVGAYSTDNPVEIVLHGLTASEALILAEKFTAYALDQRKREGSAQQEARAGALKLLIRRLWSFWPDGPVESMLMSAAAMALIFRPRMTKDLPPLHEEAFGAARELLRRAATYVSDPAAYEATKEAKPVVAFARAPDKPND